MYIHVDSVGKYNMLPIHVDVRSHSNTWIGVSGNTLEHDCCSSITERAIDDIGVSRDPANVSHTGKDVIVFWVVVKGILDVDGEEEQKERDREERERGWEREKEREKGRG